MSRLENVIAIELDNYIREMVREAIRGQLQLVTSDDTALYHKERDIKSVIGEAVRAYLTREKVVEVIKTITKDSVKGAADATGITPT